MHVHMYIVLYDSVFLTAYLCEIVLPSSDLVQNNHKNNILVFVFYRGSILIPKYVTKLWERLLLKYDPTNIGDSEKCFVSVFMSGVQKIIPAERNEMWSWNLIYAICLPFLTSTKKKTMYYRKHFQHENSNNCNCAAANCNFNSKFHWNHYLQQIPVSYTHLDVYKRQPYICWIIFE